MSPSKKQKRVHVRDQPSDPRLSVVLPDVHADIDLEIAMRMRLTETLESRIAWAQSLQDAIRKGNGISSSGGFRTTALNTLTMIEEPTRFIVDPEPIPPPSTASQSIIRPPPPRKLGHNYNQVEFLFTRSSSLLDENESSVHQLYILKCPMCGRTSFSKLQGLLNHARMRHSLEWGTHDECITACAVPDNTIDTSLGLEVGISLPGLRTLFRNAVASKPATETNQPEASSTTPDVKEPVKGPAETHLNQTLGLHADSPSLAPFLGKNAIRREIKVWESDSPIDIEVENSSASVQVGRPRWRMPFGQRNTVNDSFPGEEKPAEKELHQVDNISEVSNALSNGTPQNVISGQGRFHFFARIIITDRSMSVPESSLPEEHKGFTHKWMISVVSPSYAHPITSILHSIKVSASNPAISIPTPPEKASPPFVVVGLADKPFLARVELAFAGTSSSSAEQPYQIMVFEHWVDLDPLKTNTVVLGQDQVLDVELDNTTVLLPERQGSHPIESKLWWNQPLKFEEPVEKLPVVKTAKLVQGPAEPLLKQPLDDKSNVDTDKSSTLAQVVAQFPLLRTDITEKQHQSLDLPYTLASSQAEFNSMLLGRRKAIEWRRLRAIRDAYNDQQHVPSAMISAHEVYEWLSDTGRLPRAQPHPGAQKAEMKEEGNAQSMPSGQVSGVDQWCATCGLHSSIHGNQGVANHLSIESQEVKPMLPQTERTYLRKTNNTCEIVPGVLQVAKLPRTDIEVLKASDKRHTNPRLTATTAVDYRPLISMTDPQLLQSILYTANQLNLPTVRALTRPSEGIMGAPSYPLQSLGGDCFEVEQQLAPYAVLGVATQLFIRQLITRGLEVANRDKVVSTGVAPQGSSTRRRQDLPASERLLTPTHILSGILTRGRGRGQTRDAVDAVILSCLSKLGVAVEPPSVTPSRQGQKEIHVKMEE